MNRSRDLNSLIEDLNQLKKNGGIQLTDKTSVPKKESEDQHEKQAEAGSDESTDSGSKSESESSSKSEITADAQPEPELSHTGNGSENPPPMMREEAQSETSPSFKSEAEEENESTSEHDQQGPEQKSTKSAPELQAAEEEEEDDFLMIKPTLGYAKGISSPQGVVDQKADVETVVEEKYPDPIKLTSVDDLGSHWGSFVDKVKNEAPRMLYMQVLRVSLKELKGNKLVVTADNEFATNLFDENQQLLSNLMKRTVGIRIRIKCIVERQTKKKETKSPYERFKELQKKDPHLKTVVELFGAELDY
jgi:DNA polymerase-3 subunit gamma/tau